MGALALACMLVCVSVFVFALQSLSVLVLADFQDSRYYVHFIYHEKHVSMYVILHNKKIRQYTRMILRQLATNTYFH